MRSVMHSPVLVLNASYEPLHICAARRALTLVVKDVAHIQEHAGREVHAGIMFPTVIRLKAYRKLPHRVDAVTCSKHACGVVAGGPVVSVGGLFFLWGVFTSHPRNSSVEGWTLNLGELGRMLL